MLYHIYFKSALQVIAFISLMAFHSVKPSVSVKVSDISIKKAGRPGNVKIGTMQSQLIKIFGQPSKIKDYYFETEDKHGKIITYPGCIFYIADGKLQSFKTSSAAFAVSIAPAHFIHTGEDIGNVMHQPLPKDGALIYNLTDEKGNNLETNFLEIDFNKSTHRITKIWIGDKD